MNDFFVELLFSLLFNRTILTCYVEIKIAVKLIIITTFIERKLKYIL